MKHVLIAGLALALSAGAAQARTPQTPPLDQAYKDDVQCAVLYMAIAAKGEDPGSAALGFYYFIGRLEGRRPEVNWRSHVLTAAANSGRAMLEAHGARCGNILIENGRSMTQIDGVIQNWAQGVGQMGEALQAMRDEQGEQAPEQPTSGW
ncbi:hypothetical protein N0B44_29195 [Roseibacterium beibuensis]|uniref:hypothetical protein n=1 Tax=[Roseibacterium] beibuensis TaxID=1193142 RepID=UPI00217DD1A0|nr:hypothetical protein [Roseibacterium beibuensis]MCS6627001.1 hypothetical protein [Roseibacterium beibuensis]